MELPLAPNIAPDEIDNYIADKGGIQQLLRATASVLASQYAGTVKLGLCNNCKFKKEPDLPPQTN